MPFCFVVFLKLISLLPLTQKIISRKKKKNERKKEKEIKRLRSLEFCDFGVLLMVYFLETIDGLFPLSYMRMS